ncbi:MAG: DUF4398 domain-containing protein [Usitatibacter sp.]
MTPHSIGIAAVAIALTVAGCAMVPRTNSHLEDARTLYRAAHEDREIARLAPSELARAEDTFHLAEAAWNTLDDPAVVDHLAYLAKQRIAIAREIARKASAEEAALAARLGQDTDLATAGAGGLQLTNARR